jgi:hypothetical protein
MPTVNNRGRLSWASYIAGHFFPDERPDETADALRRDFG